MKFHLVLVIINIIMKREGASTVKDTETKVPFPLARKSISISTT